MEQVKLGNRCDAGLNRWYKNAKRSGGLVPVLLLQHIDWAFFFLRRKTESLTIIPQHESGIKSLEALITNSEQLFDIFLLI